MQRLKHLSRPAWLTAGVLVGAIAVPAVTVAATATIVNVQGTGHTAAVSSGGQLRTIEMDPSNLIHLRGATNNCINLGAPPAGRAWVLKSVSFANINTASAGDYVSAVLMANPCGFGSIPLADAEFNVPGNHDVSLGDGVAIPSGTEVALQVSGGNVTANVYGYSITSSAVPHTATVMRNLGPATSRRR
jgi:hypothetical protein